MSDLKSHEIVSCGRKKEIKLLKKFFQRPIRLTDSAILHLEKNEGTRMAEKKLKNAQINTVSLSLSDEFP